MSISSADNEVQRALSEQAAHWMLLLQTGELSAEQRGAFVDWLRASPLHIAEMLHICELDVLLARMPDWKEMAPETDYESPVVQFSHRAPAARASPSRMRPRDRWLAAACLAVLIVFGGVKIARWGDITLETSSGEHRQVTLSDGSVVNLEPNTDLVVRYEAHRRLVYLNRGEAMFRDTDNPARPFIVEAAQTSVRAVGTIFDVARGAGAVSVNVVEGRVAISQHMRLASWFRRQPRLHGAVISLAAHQAVTMSLAGTISAIRGLPSATGRSRAAGQLVFADQTMEEVARRFNDHNRVQIKIVDPNLASLKMSGVFNADDPESLVAFIRAVADVRVKRVGANEILVGSASDPKFSAVHQ